MSTRDRYAVIAGVILGIVSAVLSAAAAFAAGLVFLAFSLINPLVVSLIAQNRIMTLSQIPNLLMALILGIIVALFGISTISRYDPAELSIGILAALAMAVVPAFVISGLVKLIRGKSRRA